MSESTPNAAQPGRGFDRAIAPVSRMWAANVASWTCAVLVVAGAAQAPVPISIWQRIRYPSVTIPGTAPEHLTFLVSSGGHKTGPREERSHLRLDVVWTTREGVPRPTAIAGAGAVLVELHTADGKVLTPSPSPDWLGAGMGGWTAWSLTSTFPWSRNVLDEAWFEVRAGGQTWWIELPYGFARNPEDFQAAANKNKNFNVTLLGTRGWVAQAAWEATRAGHAFTRADVPDEWRTPALHMIASPRLPDQKSEETAIPSPIRSVFIRAYGLASDVDLKPLSDSVRTHRVWKNSQGATVEYDDVSAVFDPRRAIALPGERLTLTVVTDAGERTCERSIGDIENIVKDQKPKKD